MTWFSDPSRWQAVDHLDELRRALDTATEAPGAVMAFCHLEIAVGELLAARTIAWDHLGADRAAVVAELDFCGIPHPLLRKTDPLEV